MGRAGKGHRCDDSTPYHLLEHTQAGRAHCSLPNGAMLCNWYVRIPNRVVQLHVESIPNRILVQVVDVLVWHWVPFAPLLVLAVTPE